MTGLINNPPTAHSDGDCYRFWKRLWTASYWFLSSRQLKALALKGLMGGPGTMRLQYSLMNNHIWGASCTGRTEGKTWACFQKALIWNTMNTKPHESSLSFDFNMIWSLFSQVSDHNNSKTQQRSTVNLLIAGFRLLAFKHVTTNQLWSMKVF